jgi:large exoprotein involved in heme utilization and adhesion
MMRQYLKVGMAMAMGAIALFPAVGVAQLRPIEDTAPDRALGTMVVPLNAQIDLIREGTRSANGANLVHSFQEFNIGEGRGAYFIVPDATVVNILARVTGGNPS